MTDPGLKKRNRAVLIVLLTVIVLIFAITIVKIRVVGQMAVATPATPYGHASGEPDNKSSGDLPADKPAPPAEDTHGDR